MSKRSYSPTTHRAALLSPHPSGYGVLILLAMGSLPWPVKELEGPLQVSERPHLTLPSVPGIHPQGLHRAPAGLMRPPNWEPEGTLQTHHYPASEHSTQWLPPVPLTPQLPISGPAGFSEPLKNWSEEQNPGRVYRR